ncbi:MAG TPA: 4Fe-4S dicluster domain-containing protein [Thermoleophilia bacterium]|nr:4Fe-4S dicluster domain-containing protein [Thermoleophilia bacterium]
MAIRANPKLIEELEPYGAEDVMKCYHCGNCSAVCPFSQDPYVFPRKPMRNLQLGLEEKLEGDLDPWLCYYCGECSDQCPRDAEPGETMMSLRRWLTSRYDWTGISRLFYRSWRWELGAIILVAVITAIAFSLFGLSQGSLADYDGPNAFLPSSAIHIFDWALAVVLLVLLLSNATRMWWFTMGRDKTLRTSLGGYVRSLWMLPAHFLTQIRYSQCDRKAPWVTHLALMLSYVVMLVLIMFFLAEMASGPSIDWRVHVLGYLATAGLVVSTILFLRNRTKKSAPQYQHSHESDWIFLVLILVVALTGILQHILHRSGLDVAANVTYIVHLSLVVPMLALEVPFSKWSHLAYRPLAIYLAHVRAIALARSRQGDEAARRGAEPATPLRAA